MNKFITCVAMTPTGGMGSDNPDTHYLPFTPVQEDLSRLKDIVKDRTVLITENSFQLLPKSFKNFIINECVYVVRLSSRYSSKTEHIGGNMYGLQLDSTTRGIKPSLRASCATFLDESDVVYIGGSYFVEQALLHSDYSFLTIIPNNNNIKETHGVHFSLGLVY